MIYYGAILFKLRRPAKVTDCKEVDNDQFERLDKVVFVIYSIVFLLYNFGYFSTYIDQIA